MNWLLTVWAGVGAVQLIFICIALDRTADELDKINDKLSIVIKQRRKDDY